eukprot:1160104-Pelagomonas_calceolata.AAC.8
MRASMIMGSDTEPGSTIVRKGQEHAWRIGMLNLGRNLLTRTQTIAKDMYVSHAKLEPEHSMHLCKDCFSGQYLPDRVETFTTCP